MIEFYLDKAGEHRWRVTAANGEIIAAASEGYYTRTGAMANAKLVHIALAQWAETEAWK